MNNIHTVAKMFLVRSLILWQFLAVSFSLALLLASQ